MRLQCRRPQFNSWVWKIRWGRNRLPTPVFLGFLCVSTGKESACNAGGLGSIPGLGRSPGEGKGYPLQYSCLENSMDCIVHGVTTNPTQLSDFHSLTYSLILQVSETLIYQSNGNFNSSDFLSGGWVGREIHSPSPPSFLQTLCGFSPSASKRVLLSSDLWVRGLLVAESSESSFSLLLLGQKTLWSSIGCPDYPLTFCLVDFCSSPPLPRHIPQGLTCILFSLYSLSASFVLLFWPSLVPFLYLWLLWDSVHVSNIPLFPSIGELLRTH